MKKWLIAAVVLSAAAVYFALDPSGSGLFPKCPFFVLTGLECPGCGSQRALHALLHLDVVAAFRYNALFVVSIPAVLVLGYAEAVRTRRPDLYRKVNNPKLIMGYFVIVILWWVGRNMVSFI